jgi:hypothetical protein
LVETVRGKSRITGAPHVICGEVFWGMLRQSDVREVHLKATERKALEKPLAKRTGHAGHVRRARIILLAPTVAIIQSHRRMLARIS